MRITEDNARSIAKEIYRHVIGLLSSPDDGDPEDQPVTIYTAAEVRDVLGGLSRPTVAKLDRESGLVTIDQLGNRRDARAKFHDGGKRRGYTEPMIERLRRARRIGGAK